MLHETTEPLRHIENADARVSQLMEEIINQDQVNKEELIDQLMLVSDTLRLLMKVIEAEKGQLPMWRKDTNSWSQAH